MYKITEDTVLSISGGRTSAYILAKVIEHNDGLPDNCFPIFQNTGKEKPQTYTFLKALAQYYGIKIVWLEYWGKKSYKVVDYDTCDMRGKPFEQAIIDNSYYLPNQVQRSCTIKMKAQTMSYYLKDQGFNSIVNWVGIRADEPKRFGGEGVSYKKDKDGYVKTYKNGDPVPVNLIVEEEKYFPLRHAGVIKSDILAFWDKMPFDLELGPNESNCDLCFMKGASNIVSEIRRSPSLADWWIKQEEMVSNHHGKPVTFRPDRPSYKELKIIATTQGDMFGDYDNLPCGCAD